MSILFFGIGVIGFVFSLITLFAFFILNQNKFDVLICLGISILSIFFGLNLISQQHSEDVSNIWILPVLLSPFVFLYISAKQIVKAYKNRNNDQQTNSNNTFDEITQRSYEELRQLSTNIDHSISTRPRSTLQGFFSEEIGVPPEPETEPLPSTPEVHMLTMQDVDQMGGWGFENFIADMLRQNGFADVSTTEYTGDYGVDVYGRKDGQLYVIQCKCYANSNIGVKAIQEVYSGKGFYNANVAVVATNSHFTRNAVNLANQLGILLWDREKIKEMADIPEDLEFSNNSIIQQNQISNNQLTSNNYNNTLIDIGDDTMTKIGPGTYVFGEDIPMGKYNLFVLSGRGMLTMQGDAKNSQDYELWVSLGLDDNLANSYRNLSLPQGWRFQLDGNLVVEIKKAQMLEID